MCLQPFSQFCRIEAAEFDQGFLKLWIPGKRLMFGQMASM